MELRDIRNAFLPVDNDYYVVINVSEVDVVKQQLILREETPYIHIILPLQTVLALLRRVGSSSYLHITQLLPKRWSAFMILTV